MSHERNFHETDPGYAVIFILESNVASSKWPRNGETRENNYVCKTLFNRHITDTGQKK
jgi:hypothetical protein